MSKLFFIHYNMYMYSNPTELAVFKHIHVLPYPAKSLIRIRAGPNVAG